MHAARELVPPLLIQFGRGIPAKGDIGLGVAEADTTERVAASFCLSHPGSVLPEGRRPEGFPSTSSQRKEWVFGAYIPRIVAPFEGWRHRLKPEMGPLFTYPVNFSL